MRKINPPVNTYKTAALCIDGKLIAAAEEERFCRVKHWGGFPSEGIRYCLAEGGIRLSDIDFVAINQNTKANIWKKAVFMAKHRPDLSLVLDRIKNKRKRVSIAEKFSRAFPNESFRANVRPVEHHLAHLASAFLVSPFRKT